jgi:hypothetical protein
MGPPHRPFAAARRALPAPTVARAARSVDKSLIPRGRLAAPSSDRLKRLKALQARTASRAGPCNSTVSPSTHPSACARQEPARIPPQWPNTPLTTICRAHFLGCSLEAPFAYSPFIESLSDSIQPPHRLGLV